MQNFKLHFQNAVGKAHNRDELMFYIILTQLYSKHPFILLSGNKAHLITGLKDRWSAFTPTLFFSHVLPTTFFLGMMTMFLPKHLHTWYIRKSLLVTISTNLSLGLDSISRRATGGKNLDQFGQNSPTKYSSFVCEHVLPSLSLPRPSMFFMSIAWGRF